MLAADTIPLKALVDHYMMVDELVHATRRPVRDSHGDSDARLADMTLETGRRSLSVLLEQRYGVIYEGRRGGRGQVRAPGGDAGDSAFLSQLSTLLSVGIAHHDSTAAMLLGADARALVLRLRFEEQAALDRIRQLHPDALAEPVP